MCLAIPGRVVEVVDDHGLRMGRVDFGGTIKKVVLEHVPEAVVGDYSQEGYRSVADVVDTGSLEKVRAYKKEKKAAAKARSGT